MSSALDDSLHATERSLAVSSDHVLTQLQPDVYICFRGQDSRYGFVSHLEASLCRRGINTFQDEDLEKDDISLQLLEKSEVFLIIFSENFAASPRCLDELTKILEQREKYGKIVIPIFLSVDPSSVRLQTGPYADAFLKHEQLFPSEKVQRWRVAFRETTNLSGLDSRQARNEATLVNLIVGEVDKHLRSTSRMKARIEWTVVITNFILEIPSAVFDQLSSVHKPLYALVGMLISLLSVVVCIANLIYRGRAERVRWHWNWPIPGFYYPSPISKRFGSLVDTIGSVCALCQCIVTIINYSFMRVENDGPIKISVWPMLFALGLLCSKFMQRSGKRAVD